MGTMQYKDITDTTELRNLILENPKLPLLVFCSEDANSGYYGYELSTDVTSKIEEIALYNDELWCDGEDYADRLANDLADEEEYKEMQDEHYLGMINEMVGKVEFVKAIVVKVG